MVLVLSAAAALWAQTEAADASGTVKTWGMWETIKAGSWIGAIIIMLSVAVVALVIEHFMTITDEKLIPPDFVAALQAHIEERRYQDAIDLCEVSDNYISRVMQVGLSEIRYGYDAMVESMSGIGEEESIKLNQKIGYLSFIGMIAPMLGLLGTVTGMVISFNKIATAEHGVQASELAYGISQALVTTVEGLVTAIPAMFFFTLFQDRVTNIGLEAGAVCEELIRKFKPVKVQGVQVSVARKATQPAGQPASTAPSPKPTQG